MADENIQNYIESLSDTLPKNPIEVHMHYTYITICKTFVLICVISFDLVVCCYFNKM